jgi:nucleoid-associated protein YgaU
MQDNKLFVQGDAPSEDANSRVWDQIKLVNPNWQSELTADIRVASQQQAISRVRSSTAERTYTVKPGDTLSKIDKEMYGNPNEYQRIFDTNRDQLTCSGICVPAQILISAPAFSINC